MKGFVIAAATTLLMTSATGALASQDTGTIKSINKTSDSITLADGKEFKLPESIEAEKLKVGERVRVDYSTDAGGKTTVSNVVPMK